MMMIKTFMQDNKRFIPFVLPIFLVVETMDVALTLISSNPNLTKPSFENSFFWVKS